MAYNAVNIEEVEQDQVLHQKHAKFFMRFLNLLPARMASHDSTRSTIAFFSICGLDVLKSLHLLTPETREDIIEWIYGNLVEPCHDVPCCSGFQGSRMINVLTNNDDWCANIRRYQWGHLAMTYTSIGMLVTLGDDLKRLNRQRIVDGVAAVQRPDGSFSACIDGSENDMRFVYCAAAICNMLDYWGSVSKEKMFSYIMNSFRYDYGFSQHLDGEAHGGTTFCALAALELSGQLHRLDKNKIEGIKRWLIFRQVDGFQGRPNKPVDTCYSFWIGAALRILNAFEMIDYVENRKYILQTQDNIVGGFAKWPQSSTDPFHTYFGLCGLSFMNESGLTDVMPSLNFSIPAYQHLQSVQRRWRAENANDSHKLPTTQITAKENNDEQESITTPLISAQ